MNNTNNITEFINHVKHNYKTNFGGYVLVWILLLIPITFCIIQTVKLNNWNGDIQNFRYEILNGMDVKEYFPVYVGGIFKITFLFVILSVVVITTVVKLSSKNNSDFKYRRLYIILSILLYCIVLYTIMLWCSKVTVLIHYGSAISDESISSPSLPYYCIMYLICIGIYLGICTIFYRIISWLIRKRRMLFVILSILLIVPIWIYISKWFVTILLLLMF